MTMPRLLNRLSCLLLCIGLGTAHADKLDDDLQTVWESLWDQRGTPRVLLRWGGPALPYRIHGADAARHQAHIEGAIKAAADIAKLALVDVSVQADGGTAAMLDIEVVDDTALQSNEPCLTRHLEIKDGALRKVEVKMRSRDAWRCTHHEMMHAMGILGHPSGRTVLSYFPYRRDVFMALDQLMLAAWYAPAMPRNATPLEALVVLSGAVAGQSDLALEPGEAVSRAGAFNRRALAQLEALASGQGEVPAIVRRSGKASDTYIEKARPMVAFFVGMAYLRGVIANKNPAASAPWLKRSAEQGYLPAQLMWASALIDGTGVEVDRPAGHAWLTLAAKTGIPSIANFLALAEKTMSSEELVTARALPAPAVNPP